MAKKSSHYAPIQFLRSLIGTTEERCIEWPFCRNPKGYGLLIYEGKGRPAHRVMLILSTGADMPGLDAAHKPIVCHNRACVNPNHLEWLTRSENLFQKAMDGTDMRGEKNHKAKLNEDQVREIRAAPESASVVAARYGVHKTTVVQIRSRRKWAHVH